MRFLVALMAEGKTLDKQVAMSGERLEAIVAACRSKGFWIGSEATRFGIP